MHAGYWKIKSNGRTLWYRIACWVPRSILPGENFINFAPCHHQWNFYPASFFCPAWYCNEDGDLCYIDYSTKYLSCKGSWAWWNFYLSKMFDYTSMYTSRGVVIAIVCDQTLHVALQFNNSSYTTAYKLLQLHALHVTFVSNSLIWYRKGRWLIKYTRKSVV